MRAILLHEQTCGHTRHAKIAQISLYNEKISCRRPCRRFWQLNLYCGFQFRIFMARFNYCFCAHRTLYSRVHFLWNFSFVVIFAFWPKQHCYFKMNSSCLSSVLGPCIQSCKRATSYKAEHTEQESPGRTTEVKMRTIAKGELHRIL
jgi:hypothetical protein